MRQRLDHLEQMVQRLVSQQPPQPTPSPDVSQAGSDSVSLTTSNSGPIGMTVIERGHSVYKPAEDWYDVLQEINELKKTWSESQDAPEEVSQTLSNSVDGTSLLFGQVERVDVADILASLPSRVEVEKLSDWFFDRSRFPVSIPPIIHEQTFRQELAKHWDDPSRSSIIWVGLLFSILGITMLACQLGEPPEYRGISEQLFHLYRLRTAQCLLIGDIAKCLPYTIETLRFNATAELNRKDDNSRGLWIMTGVVVRAAVNMGYHRDPDHTPSLSVLEAEYRRRVWLSVVGMDEVASFMSGFPRMIPAINADTKEPHNLLDSDLTHETASLPASRPETEITPASYMIAKGRLFTGLGEIIDFITGPSADNYARAFEIDQYLENTYWNLPSHLRLDAAQLTSDSLTTPTDYSKLQLMFLYHHGICTLHRKFIRKDHNEPSWHISRSRCISSSMAIIDYQGLAKPLLYTYSRNRQMIARAAMTLLLELESRRQGPKIESEVETAAILQSFEKAVSLWSSASSSCDEASKMYKVLNNMLRSYKAADEANASLLPGFENDAVPFEDDLLHIPEGMSIDWAWWDEFIEGALF
ncbi:hypothetical protein BJY04DRAFT_220369 [Aspergillus karnatakaensis]|uniref:fungal specific transcription factor domain-containing protein n=1 Tax=Aspergillus karnatakaensis TaxID=1810916 RepID=UPI003CCD01B6